MFGGVRRRCQISKVKMLTRKERRKGVSTGNVSSKWYGANKNSAFVGPKPHNKKIVFSFLFDLQKGYNNMTRVKRQNVSRNRHKKVLKITQGFRGSSSTLFRTAKQQNMKALRYSYRDRNQRKREFRSLWITRMNAAIRVYGMNYSKFIHNIKKSETILNRKILAQLALRDKEAFQQLIQSLS